MATDVGIRIGVEGEKEFKTAISGVNSQLKSLDAEMKAVTQAFDSMADSEEAIAQKSDVLQRSISTQGQKIDLLRGQYDRARAKLDDLADELDRVNREFGESSTEAMKARNAYNRQATEVNKLSSQINTAEADIGRMRREMDNLGKSADDLSDNLDDAGGSFDKFIKGGAIIGTITGIASALSSAVEASKEYGKIMGALEVSSENAGYSSEQTADSYNRLYGVLGDSQQSATALANLQAMGLSQEQLNEMIDLTIGAWAKYGDSIPIDGLAEAVNETVKVGEVTGTFADALNWAGISEEEFNAKLQATNSETERANLIADALASQGLADMADAYRENNTELVAMNEAEAKLADATAQVGEVFMPVFTSAKIILAEVLLAVVSVINNIEPFLPLLASVGTAITALALPTLISTVKNLTGGTGLLKTGFTTLFTVLKANPIGAVITLIASLVTGIITAYQTNEEFRNKVDAVWNTIKNIVITNVETLISTVQKLPSLFKQAGRDMFNGIKEGMASVWSSLKSWVQDKINWLTDKLAFWRRGQSEMSGGDSYDGSHAGGLAYVPFDGYIAQLHKGERVLTAGENRVYSSNSRSVQNVFHVSATVREDADIKRIAQELYALQRNDSRGRGVVMA